MQNSFHEIRFHSFKLQKTFFITLDIVAYSFMNPNFETIRKDLKRFNAEENEAPPKLLLAGADDFFSLGHERKTNTQFIMCIKRFYEPQRPLVAKLIDDLTTRAGKKALVFYYDDENAIKTVLEDFKDYYNTGISDNIFQNIGPSIQNDKCQFCMIIYILESYYYR